MTLCAGLQRSIALPDMHSGYGFAIGNVAAFDMSNPEAVVSPGGVGFDINCGVRLIRTNLVRPLLPVSSPSDPYGCRLDLGLRQLTGKELTLEPRKQPSMTAT